MKNGGIGCGHNAKSEELGRQRTQSPLRLTLGCLRLNVSLAYVAVKRSEAQRAKGQRAKDKEQRPLGALDIELCPLPLALAFALCRVKAAYDFS